MPMAMGPARCHRPAAPRPHLPHSLTFSLTPLPPLHRRCLRQFGCTIQTLRQGLEQEVKTGFTDAMKASMVQFLVNDPKGKSGPTPLAVGLDFSTTWRDDFQRNRDLLAAQLLITVPAARRMQAIWGCKYAGTLLVDFPALLSKQQEMGEPFTVHNFALDIKSECEDRVEELNTNWYPEVLQLFTDRGADGETVASRGTNPEREGAFLQATNVIMGRQLAIVVCCGGKVVVRSGTTVLRCLPSGSPSLCCPRPPSCNVVMWSFGPVVLPTPLSPIAFSLHICPRPPRPIHVQPPNHLFPTPFADLRHAH